MAFPCASARRRFTLLRVGLALGLPLVFALLVLAARDPSLGLPGPLGPRLAGLSDGGLARGAVLLVALGYYGP